MELSGFSHQSRSFVLLINSKMPTIVGILTYMSRINFMLGWAESERSFITSGPSVHVSGTKMSYMLLLVLFSILSFGFLFFHVHHLCMPLLGPELVNKILVSCILYLVYYASTVWYLHTNQYIKKVEAVQRRTERCATRN